MRDKYSPQKIKVSNGEGDYIEISLHWEADAQEWLGAFRAILYWSGFHIETINKYLGGEDEQGLL